MDGSLLWHVKYNGARSDAEEESCHEPIVSRARATRAPFRLRVYPGSACSGTRGWGYVAHKDFHVEGWIWLVPFVSGLVLGAMFIVLMYSVYRELRQLQ